MKKKLIITILSILILFFGITGAKNYLSYKIPNTAMGVRSVVAKGHVDTLFIGSSGYRKGIDMQKVVDSIDGESFMLTYNGNEPFNIYIELKEILKENVTVNRLIVDFNPSMADRGADLSDKRLLWDISMDGKIELWNKLKSEESTDLFTMYDYWVLSNNDYMVTYPISYKLISKRYCYGGSTPSDETAGKSKEELEELNIVENPGVNELQRQSIIAIIDLCKENDIELIFMESPRYITMESNVNYQEKTKELIDIIEEENQRINGEDSTRTRIVLREDLGFDNSRPEYYSDLTHMSKEGKEQLTDCVISMLK